MVSCSEFRGGGAVVVGPETSVARGWGPGDHQKTHAVSGEGPFGSALVLRLAPDPPRSSVLLPGAGNEAKKAGKTERKGPKKAEEGYVIREAQIFQRHLHAPSIRRDDDGDVAAIPTVEQAQCGLPDRGTFPRCARQSSSERQAGRSSANRGIATSEQVRRVRR